jgi:hypothetical protein
MGDDRISRNITVYRRDSVHFVVAFPKPLPASWEDLQLVFKAEAGGRISKFIKNSPDVRIEAREDGSVRYAFTFTIDGTDALGTFKLVEGAVRLHDGFIIHWNPKDDSAASQLTMTVDYTPEKIEAIDAFAETNGV